MRLSIKDPIPEIFAAWEALSAAVDAHLLGDHITAAQLLKQADCRVTWSWLNPAWVDVDSHVVNPNPEGDTQSVARSERDPIRNILAAVKNAALQRDGYRCRYCGIPVVSADIRKRLARLYPDAVPWNPRLPEVQHAGLQSLWLQFDHVVPHSHGGRSDLENVVVACALCNFGKHGFTLRQLGVSDPRLRPPVLVPWDGLERLRAIQAPRLVSDLPRAFFIAGARIDNGYLLTPQIDGKERWFTLSTELTAVSVLRGDVAGYQLRCPPSYLRSRGIDFERLLDIDD